MSFCGLRDRKIGRGYGVHLSDGRRGDHRRHCQGHEQAEGILNALVDQAYLNGADAVKPAALVAAHNAVFEAAQQVKAIRPASTRSAMDSDRYRRAVSLLTVLLEKTENDESGIQVCDSLETAIAELKAAGGMEP